MSEPRDLCIAAVQFEHRDGQKAYNLDRIAELTRRAAEQGAQVVSFHECSVTAYSFVQPLSREELAQLAEPVPEGPSTQRLIQIAAENKIHLLAGLFEQDGEDLFNTYLCVSPQGLVAKHRKLHAFVNPHLSSGSEITTFDIHGWKASLLICYDNNLPENVRIAALQGAEIVFMPHVTGCLPSCMPGRGTVDPALWHNRRRDPVPLRLELDGPKGRSWLMKWLPARAWENGIYLVFTNPIGLDYGQVRGGPGMVIDPFGEVIAECRALEDDFCLGLCIREKLELSSGRRYLRARRPDLYGKLVEPSKVPPETLPGWTLESSTEPSSENF